MIVILICLLALLAGYLFFGKLVERIFSPDGERITPAYSINDGVDCVPISEKKDFLIQLLNIAGTGPIFGAIMGAVFGPVVFLWIVLGSILGGAVHDFMCGMISARNGGGTIAEISGIYMGRGVKLVMRIFTLVLSALVGTVFVTSPAALLARFTTGFMSARVWVLIILFYYVLATLLPIDKVISKFYPVFGVFLCVMALGIFGSLFFTKDISLPSFTLANLNPNGLPVWPYMFVTVACGAISGFHATQSPIAARCLQNEKQGRAVFYGAMIVEAVIALIWASVSLSFYGSTGSLNEALSAFGQSGVVYDISLGLLGKVGGVIAIIGVVICPITSGDTAFRSARLVLAEWTGLKQNKIGNRLILTIPLLTAAYILTNLDFNVLWRYFSWSNQTLAMISLWVSTAFLLKESPNRFGSLITAVPGSFMVAVTVTYLLMAPEGFRVSAQFAYPVGVIAAVILFVIYLFKLSEKLKTQLLK